MTGLDGDEKVSMSDDDLAEIVESGERLPNLMFDEDLLTEALENIPVSDGDKPVGAKD